MPFISPSRYTRCLMRNLVLLILLPLFLAGCVFQGKRRYTLDRQESSHIQFRALETDHYAEKYPEEDGVYLFREEMVELVHRAPWNGHPSYHAWHTEAMRYLILNPENDELTTFDLEVDEDMELKKIYINLIAPDGSVREFGLQDMNVEIDSRGNQRYRLAYPGVVRGTVVDAGYETLEDPIQTGTYHHELSLQYSMPCERLSVRYVHPKGWEVAVQGGEYDEPQWRESYSREIDKDRGIKIAAYDAWNVPPLYDEPYSPYRGERLRRLEGVVQSAWMADYHVRMMPSSWDSYGSTMISGMLADNDPDERQIRQHVDTLLDRNADDRTKVEGIITWFNENVRLRSLDRSIEYDPVEVIGRGEGRTQEITALAGLMMLNAGLDTDFLLVHSAFDPPVEVGFIAPGLYYTPALSVEVGDSTLYLFPWIKNYPIGHIPSFLQQQPALALSTDGFREETTVPESDLTKSVTSSTYDVEIDREGVATVVEKRRLEGEAAFFLRRRTENLDGDELEERMKDLVIYEGGEVDFKGYDIENREEFDRPLIITLRYTIDGMVTVTPDEAIVRIEELFSPSFSYTRKVRSSERKNPIRIYTDEEINKRVTLRVPENWRVGPLPDDLREETSFGIATASYSYRPGELTATYSRSLRRSERPAEHYQELLLLIGKDSKLNLSTLVFTY